MEPCSGYIPECCSCEPVTEREDLESSLSIAVNLESGLGVVVCTSLLVLVLPLKYHSSPCSEKKVPESYCPPRSTQLNAEQSL